MEMSKILLFVVGFLSLVEAAPSAEPCVIILPPPKPSTVRPATSATPTASVTPTASGSAVTTVAPITPTATAPASVPSGPPPLTPDQLATLTALYNMYMEFLKSQPGGPPAVPFPPPA